MSTLHETLWRARGTREWDLLIRGMGVLGLLALYPAYRWTPVATLTGFLLVTLFVNGPLGPFLPAAYEPVLMMMGRVYPPMVVAAVGISGVILVDLVDYYLYRALLLHPALAPARGSWLLRKASTLFDRAPFFTVWVCAVGVLPHVAVRILAPLSGYSVQRYLLATFLGRAPRLWFFAAIGAAIPVSTSFLVFLTIAMILAAPALMLHRSRSGRPNIASPAEEHSMSALP